MFESQRSLREVLALNRRGMTEPHVLIAMPSFSLGESTLAHYAQRIPALEHRYLNALFLLASIPGCTMVYLCTDPPSDAALEYYFSLLPAPARESARHRLHLVSLGDHSVRSLAQKLLDRPDVIQSLRAFIGGRPAFIEPWNVTDHEMEVAAALGVPVNGTTPDLWPLGFKSACRTLFRHTGVPLPRGTENVTSIEGVRAAIDQLCSDATDALGVVIKHDNSGSGDGNFVIRFSGPTSVEDQLAAVPQWYWDDLAGGGVVEQLISGEEFSSPSAQVDVRPDGEVVVLATHEQVLGGADAQVYQGCSFPARHDYAPDLARHAAKIGRELAARGVIGRLSVDFAATREPSTPGREGWRVYALEVNLRKGGTTHCYAALRHLVPGRYDPARGAWFAESGGTRCYCASDNLVDHDWVGLDPSLVIDAVRDAGLQFSPETGRGVALHMLSCLAIDGRLGLTSIAPSLREAQDAASAVRWAIDGMLRTSGASRAAAAVLSGRESPPGRHLEGSSSGSAD